MYPVVNSQHLCYNSYETDLILTVQDLAKVLLDFSKNLWQIPTPASAQPVSLLWHQRSGIIMDWQFPTGLKPECCLWWSSVHIMLGGERSTPRHHLHEWPFGCGQSFHLQALWALPRVNSQSGVQQSTWVNYILILLNTVGQAIPAHLMEQNWVYVRIVLLNQSGLLVQSLTLYVRT